MAPTTAALEVDSEENLNFACCKKKVNSSCEREGFSFILRYKRLEEKDHGGQYPVEDLTDNGYEKEIEIVYLKLLVDELKSKNKILEENNSLLREKVGNLEE
ncbi:hypothetical protein WA026_006537 [Henosepilachna vigintioctopunctata]|uniref:Uncharacterized protein n=1 Tax=Henosepilachna vigintioctopunctata TaxID=420089 RepID=A0AAW1UFZ4_9CUCU